MLVEGTVPEKEFDRCFIVTCMFYFGLGLCFNVICIFWLCTMLHYDYVSFDLLR